MISFDEKVRINNLFDAYGNMLTQKQQRCMVLYYDYDSSLAEISEELNITRQAVHDTISKSVSLLEQFEKNIGYVAKIEEIKLSINEVAENSDGVTNKKLKKIIDNI